MIISEDRCSCALLIERDGVREHVVFDDIGCMLDYESGTQQGVSIRERFVHDHASRSWVPAHDAVFLFAEPKRLLTPMGTGIVAFATSAEAKGKQSEVGGDVMDYERLVASRRQWIEARYGRPGGTP